MRDPLFIILSTLNSIISNLMRMFTFVFVNYFPSPKPEESGNNGFISSRK